MTDQIILLGIVFGYLGFVFIKGVAKAKKIHNTDDFLVAGRKVGWFALACTIGATMIGGGASIGAISRTYEWGILMVLISMGSYLQFILSGLLVAPKFRAAKLYTVAGYFEHRFGPRSRRVALVLSLVFSVFVIAAQMAAFGTVLSILLPKLADSVAVLKVAILIGGTMVVIYSTAGGLVAVIHTDVIQFLILMVGFIVTAAICLTQIPFETTALSAQIPAEFFSVEGGKGWFFLISTFLAFFLGETFAPGYATRFCVGKDIKTTKWGIAGIGFVLAAFFPIILFAIALYARFFHPDIDAQQALPLVVKQLHNPIIGGLLIGAILMAVMSSADSGLNSATAIFIKDVFEPIFNWHDLPDAVVLKRARWCTVLLGTSATLIAVFNTDIINLLLISYSVWAPGIVVPLIVGASMRAQGAGMDKVITWTMIGSVLATLLYRLIDYLHAKEIIDLLSPGAYQLISDIDPSVFGCAVSVALFLLFYLGFHKQLEISKT